MANPNDFSKQGENSPEAQSFVIMAYAAYKEWNKLGRSGGTSDSKGDLGPDSGASKAVVGWGVATILGLAGLSGWAIL